MPLIWRLHMLPSKKLAVSGVCGLAFVTIAFETLQSVNSTSPTFSWSVFTGTCSCLSLSSLACYCRTAFCCSTRKRGESTGAFSDTVFLFGLVRFSGVATQAPNRRVPRWLRLKLRPSHPLLTGMGLTSWRLTTHTIMVIWESTE